MSDEIEIDEEFSKLIPALSAEELEQLRKNVIAHGCLDRLKVWRTEGRVVLLDGQNRLGICRKYGVEFDTADIDVRNRQEAMDWIDRNQIGRRNLSPEMMSLIRGRLYNRQKKPPHDGGTGGQRVSGDQNAPLSTAEIIGAEFHVSPATIKRDGEFAAAVEAVKEADPDIEAKVAQGAVSKADVVKATKPAANPAKQQAAREWSIKAEVSRTRKFISEQLSDCPVERMKDFIHGIREYLDQCGGR